MTYLELIKKLLDNVQIDRSILNQSVTIYDSQSDEYFPIARIDVNIEDDIVDKGQLYLQI